jgi:hypothetical protein
MAGWIALTLWMSANSNAIQARTFEHVRSAEPRIRHLVAEGHARSAKFEEIVETVETLSCVVYIASAARLSQGMRGALLHSPVGLGEMPVLRVLLKANLSRDEAIATIGHELQHVIEAVTGKALGMPTFAAAFDELDPAARSGTIRKYETDAAVNVTVKIRDELRNAPRQR